MIFADKLIKLRKKNGWSQEELADRMSVSRQSISKWEGAQSVPDLNKILQLSNLFGVTTDYLLKDEIELEVFIDDESEMNVQKVTFAEVNSYMKLIHKVSLWRTIAIFICIVSFIPFIFLMGLAENQMFVSIDFAETVGIILFFILIAAAVAIFIVCSSALRPYHFLGEGEFELEYGVKGMLKEKQLKHQKTYLVYQIIGAVLCILSQITMINKPINSFWLAINISLMLFMIGLGTFLLVIVRIRKSSVTRLLKEGRFTEQKRKHRRVINVITVSYWLLVTAIYLIITPLTQAWENSWVVWPVSSVIFVVIIVISQFALENKTKNNE